MPAKATVRRSSGSLGVEAGLAQAAFGRALAVHVPQRAGECAGRIRREPHGLAHVPRRAPRPVGDDGGGETGALPAVAAVDVLDHLLAPLVLEVDVDVRRLPPLARDEALEQEVDPGRVDGGDAEAVADRGVGGGAPPLAEDALLPGEAHDVVHGEEIGGVAEPGNEPEFVRQGVMDLGRDAFGVGPPGAFPGQRFQMPLRRAAVGHRLVGILVSQLVEAEGAQFDDLESAGEGLLAAPEQALHLGPALEMALGVGGEAVTCRRHGDALANRGQHVLEGPARGNVIKDVVGGDQGRLVTRGERCQPVEAAPVVAPVEHVSGEVERAVMASAEYGKRRLEPLVPAVRRKHDQDLALGVTGHVVQVQHAPALGRATLTECEQAAEAAVGGTVPGIAEERGSGFGVEPRAGQQPQAGRLCSGMGAHRAGEGVAVGDADGGEAEFSRPRHQLVRVGGAAQEAEVAHRLQLGVGGMPGGRHP